MFSNDGNNLWSDVCVSDEVLNLFGKQMLTNELKVVEEHFTPWLFLNSSRTEGLNVYLPLWNRMPHDSPPYSPKTRSALGKHATIIRILIKIFQNHTFIRNTWASRWRVGWTINQSWLFFSISRAREGTAQLLGLPSLILPQKWCLLRCRGRCFRRQSWSYNRQSRYQSTLHCIQCCQESTHSERGLLGDPIFISSYRSTQFCLLWNCISS